MPSMAIKFIGKLPKINPDYLRCIYIYLVRGSEVLANTSLNEDGSFSLSLSRQTAQAGEQPLHVVVGPGGMEKHLDHMPSLQRVPVTRAHLEKAEAEFRVPMEGLKITEDVLRLWWTWCRWYCVSGNVIGPDGCPVPGAQVTAYSVGFDFWGFTKTPEVTVNADPNGHFTACFCWCTCPFCFPCWPCWPIWWDCWPWWWEFDILHVIDTLQRVNIQSNRSFAGLQTGTVLSRPVGSELIRGQGFVAARKASAEFQPDANRTAYIKNKLSNPAIREIFPWWWWCCDDPNIVFSVTQGANTIVNENPATDTRWCLEDGSTVTLVGNSQTISACSNPPVEGFAWTRVGNIPADSAHISGGYAVGTPGSDNSDLAFYAGLDIYAGFGDPTVFCYQVNAGQWTGDPSRGGTAPAASSPISANLYNYVFIYHGASLIFSGPIQMGPFNQGGLTNLYATQQARQGSGGPPPPPPGLPAFPAYSPGDLILWAYDGLTVSAEASALIGGATVGAVDLTVTAYSAALAPITLVPSGTLTLAIDETAVTTEKVTGVTAFRADGSLAPQTGTGDCPAYDVGPGGYVMINTTVSDTNGHLYEYYIDAQYGHGHEVAVASPGVRGYRLNPLLTLAPAGVCSAGDPDYACKGWIGGSDVAYFPCAPGGTQCTTSPTNGLPFSLTNLPPDCCYEFRIRFAKRVTNGYVYPSLADGDFQTISLKFSS